MIDLDAIREELADPDNRMTIEQCRNRLQQINRCWSDSYCDCHKQLLAERILKHYDALREAAGRVTCWRCEGYGYIAPMAYHEPESEDTEVCGQDDRDPCPDCADLRRLLSPAPSTATDSTPAAP